MKQKCCKCKESKHLLEVKNIGIFCMECFRINFPEMDFDENDCVEIRYVKHPVYEK